MRVLTNAHVFELVKRESKALNMPFFEDGDYDLNLFGIRGRSRVAGAFDDALGCVYRVNGTETALLFEGTTDPGAPYLERPMRPEGCGILVPGYYPGLWSLGLHNGQYEALVQTGTARVWRDNNRDAILDTFGNVTDDIDGLNLHRAGRETKTVGYYSAACQVVQHERDHTELMAGCKQQKQKRGWAKFSYKLFDVAQSPRIEALLMTLGVA